MAQTGTQKAKNVCSKCGKTFDTPEQLREHERQCMSSGAPAGESPTANAQPEKKTREEIERDMLIEEGFEATDN
jgi:hypothetical protein